MMALRTAALAAALATAEPHGHLTFPPSRNGGTLAKAADCLHGECMWFSYVALWTSVHCLPVTH
jgi:hypothetical protein